MFILNRYFRRNNSDVNLVHPSFSGITSDVEIEFEFATIAPNGFVLMELREQFLQKLAIGKMVSLK